MPSGYLAAGWRFERRMYSLSLPTTGFWIDVEHADSLSPIVMALEPDLASLGATTLDRSNVLGPNREITVLIASWMRGLILDDGSHAYGITWQSKHGHGRCWAYWIRPTDRDTAAASTESPTLLGEGKELSTNNADLKSVADQMRIIIC